MSKSIAFLMTMITLLSAANVSFAASTRFTDVIPGNESAIAIEYLAETGVVEGYSDNTFRPGSSVNRAELIKIMVAGQGINPEPGSYPSNCFNDVETGQWYEPYVCYAYSKNWIDGYSDGSFKPGNEVNRAEAVKIIVNGLSFFSSNMAISPIDSLEDVNGGDWFAGYVNAIFQSGIENLDLMEEYVFRPADFMTRENTANYIFKIKALQETESAFYWSEVRQNFLELKGLSELEDLLTM
jgi:hypothetical protein